METVSSFCTCFHANNSYLPFGKFRMTNENAYIVIRGFLYSKFSIGEVYHQIYGLKLSLTAMRDQSRKT